MALVASISSILCADAEERKPIQILLAFAWHTLCDLTARAWQRARARIATRTRFFQDLAAITGYLLFPNWAALIRTLIDGQPPPEVLQAR